MYYLLTFIVLAGVIDEDYRGNVGVVMFNHADKPFPVQKGDRIAQLICERIFYPDLQECKVKLNENKVLPSTSVLEDAIQSVSPS